jgi:hypothetical protein
VPAGTRREAGAGSFGSAAQLWNGEGRRWPAYIVQSKTGVRRRSGGGTLSVSRSRRCGRLVVPCERRKWRRLDQVGHPRHKRPAKVARRGRLSPRASRAERRDGAASNRAKPGRLRVLVSGRARLGKCTSDSRTHHRCKSGQGAPSGCAANLNHIRHGASAPWPLGPLPAVCRGPRTSFGSHVDSKGLGAVPRRNRNAKKVHRGASQKARRLELASSTRVEYVVGPRGRVWRRKAR